MKTRWIGLELRKLNNMLRRNSEFSSHRKEIETVTGNNGWVIGFLSENINAGRIVYQKTIEDHFNLSRSAVSTMLSLMEQKGLIYRETDSHDGRLKKILLTEKAEKIKTLMREDIENMESKLSRGFSETELDTLFSYLQRIKENIGI